MFNKSKCTQLGVALSALLVSVVGMAHDDLPTMPKSTSPITVFVAKKIITMDPTRPVATAVAVRDGAILSVGSLADLAPWLSSGKYVIDNQFKDKVLMPGFIDPHMHPLLGALSFEAVWITPEAWNIMGKKTPATLGNDAYMKALKTAFAARSKSDQLFITWGYSADFHGKMSRAILDEISSTEPIFVWQRSIHEAYFNTPMMNYLKSKGLDEVKFKDHPQIDWDNGHFWEDGFFSAAVPALTPYLFDRSRIDKGYAQALDYLTYNGVTTVADMSTGSANWDMEVSGLKRTFDQPDSAVRVRLTPDVMAISRLSNNPDATFDMMSTLAEKNTRHIFFNNAVKLFSDGAMFSQAMQITPPGYIDGHVGQWISQPLPFAQFASRYWNAGYQIHVHANGDGGAKMVLDTLQKIQDDKPRIDHRFTIEHYGYANDGTSRRIAKLGAQVSANPFYLYDLGDKYAESLGSDRAARIVPLGGLVRRDVPIALHSDFPMAPAEPLFLAWCTATRETMSGKIVAPSERLSLDQAIRGITIDAAYILHLEDTLGSIEAGKLADFAVLEKDPYSVGVKGIRDIKIWGTVFEGHVAKAKSAKP